MKRFTRNTALLLMLTAGSVALPCMAQQEVSPDIYEATARSSMPATKKAAKPEMKPAARRVRTQHKAANHVMLASAKTPKHVAAAK